MFSYSNGRRAGGDPWRETIIEQGRRLGDSPEYAHQFKYVPLVSVPGMTGHQSHGELVAGVGRVAWIKVPRKNYKPCAARDSRSVRY